MSKEPADWQEVHSPTEAVTVRLTGTRHKIQSRQRKADCRLFDGLLPDDVEAMVEINFVYNSFPGKPNIMMYCPDYVPGTGERSMKALELRRLYFEWAVIPSFNHAAAMDIIGLGKGLRQVDRERRKQNGWSKENVKAGLKEWRDLRGWR